MQQPILLFATLTFLMVGHIHSSPTMVVTTSASTSDSPLQSTPASPITPAPKPEGIEVDGSNAVLGDMPIVPDHSINIINRRCKCCKLILCHAKFNNFPSSLDVPLRNCKEILDEGIFSKSGLYVVQPGDGGEFVVYCDMTLLGGGWTILQRRVNNNLSFNRKYSSYKNGFGDFAENVWLGLDKISQLTDSDTSMEAYFGLEAFFGASTYTRYNKFLVEDEESGYTLRISGYDQSSTARDSMSFHNNQKFSAYDKDQDAQQHDNCAEIFKGGWWFRDCHYSNLNGIYYNDGPKHHDGISWKTWTGNRYSLKTSVIAIRPTN